MQEKLILKLVGLNFEAEMIEQFDFSEKFAKTNFRKCGYQFPSLVRLNDFSIGVDFYTWSRFWL